MSSDFNFTVTSSFLGNVRTKPYFNTQCPAPLPIFYLMNIDKKLTFFDYLPPPLAKDTFNCGLL